MPPLKNKSVILIFQYDAFIFCFLRKGSLCAEVCIEQRLYPIVQKPTECIINN